MPAYIVRLRTKPERIRAEQAVALRDMLSDFPDLPDRLRAEIIAAIDRRTASQEPWPFVMMQPMQNMAVVRWLRHNSRFPTVAAEVWAALFTASVRDTGEVAMSRDEIADLVGTPPDSVSTIMNELAGIGAVTIRRERVPGLKGCGRVVYGLNPNVATNLGGAARDRAQAEAPQLQVVRDPEPAA